MLQINRYNEIQIIREMRSPWQLIMWKENNLIKDRHTLKTDWSPGEAGWRAEGWSAGWRGEGSVRPKDTAIVSEASAPSAIQVLIHKIISGAVNRKVVCNDLPERPGRRDMLEAGRPGRLSYGIFVFL